MKQYSGFLFSKLDKIGSKSEGPVYYLQLLVATEKELRIEKKCNAWEQDKVLQAHLGTKITIEGEMISGLLRYESVVAL